MEDALKKKHFLWGVLLGISPWIPTVIGLGSAFVGVSNSKATGLAAVAGGMVELLVWWGIATMLVFQIAAIIFLLRSFSSAHILRSLTAAVFVLASGLMLLLVCAFLFWGRHFLAPAAAR